MQVLFQNLQKTILKELPLRAALKKHICKLERSIQVVFDSRLKTYRILCNSEFWNTSDQDFPKEVQYPE
jgi:hypothetical protein